jgi:gamma-glutamyltranspeptidase/glutathione hydrolase
VLSNRGIVCSVSPQACSTGIKVLLEGGNAFDAAIAVAAVETVTLPPMCGLGGDVFALLYEASSGKLVGINGSGGAPAGATPDYYWSRGYRTMPLNGPLAISVPGEVDAWETISSRFCTRSLKQLLEPAIGYAQEGYPISPKIGLAFASARQELALFPSTSAVMTKNGQAYGAGDILVQRDLAGSLRRVAEGGAGEFYRGDLARRMVKALRGAGGLFTEEDFAKHRTEVYEPPISTTYRGHHVFQVRPPSQGFVMLELLNIVEGFDLASLGHNTAESIHLMVEAKKLAFEDRNRNAGDPRFVDWDLEKLLSKDHAAARRRRIDPARVAEAAPVGAPESDGDTSYFCVADGRGNCVSFIHSLSKGFGSCFLAGGTGITFNNRAGRGFSLQEGHPNIIAPGKRTMHTLNCYMVFMDGAPVIVGGTPGGDFQVQANPQVISNLIDHGMDPQAAVDAPRWLSFPSSDPENLDKPFELRLEPGIPDDVRAGLESMGHKIRVLVDGGASSSRAQLILRDHDTGLLKGASDPRGDGHAAAM